MLAMKAPFVTALLLLATQAAAQSTAPASPQIDSLDARLGKVESRLDALGNEDGADTSVSLLSTIPDHFHACGFFSAAFMHPKHEPSTSGASLSPVFLWMPAERVFFEAELELSLEDHDTNVGLEYAQLSYLLTDTMTIGAGKFLNPGNAFLERYHPTWVNKLPDRPLGVSEESGGLLSDSQLGAQLRGSVPAGQAKVTYAIYVSNGPSLVTDDAGTAGSLAFDDYTDSNNGKAVGGRLGVQPIAGLDVGLSGERAAVVPTESDAKASDATIWAADVNYEGMLAGGRFSLIGQWVWNDIGNVNIDPNGTQGFGPVQFDDKSNAGYVEVAYRPTTAGGFLQNLEGVVRYDRLDAPSGAPFAVDENRWTIGVDYWLASATVVKLAYRFDHSSDPAAEADAVLLQFATGL